MKSLGFVVAFALAAALVGSLPPSVALGNGQEKKEDKAAEEKKDARDKERPVLPMALLAFEERGAGTKDLGAKVTDLLFAKLAAKPDLFLVDRGDIKKILDEQALSLSGAVKADEAAKVGQLTGAKLLVTGSVVQVDKKLYLVAKVISSETGRVAGASVDGAQSDDLGALAGKLADAIDDTIGKQGEKLVPKPVPVKDRVAELNRRLGKGPRPVIAVQIPEQHLGTPVAQTEITRLAKELGFTVIDLDETGKSKADVLITGQVLRAAPVPVGRLMSVSARVELKAAHRKTGTVLATDRQTAVAIDLSEQLAGAQALQDAAARLAERLLPKCVGFEPKK
jgi:TolB-like protein